MKQNHVLRAGARAALALMLGVACTVAAHAATVSGTECNGELGGSKLKLEPETAQPPDSSGGFINRLASCNMWQNFFYLNWPALAGKAGEPNRKETLGAPGETVWQTFASPDQVFLPKGKTPAPWGKWTADADVPAAIAAQVRTGKLHVLRHAVKVGGDEPKLESTEQVDNLVLYDLQNSPVYYEVALNKTLYDYIVKNHLYEATAQAKYAAKHAIAPPVGSFEIKAAWKILSQSDIANGHFYTSSAYVIPPGGKGSIQTVGLVGLHVFAGGGSDTDGNSAGLWATFAQVDNAPLAGQAQPNVSYNFYNPQSSATPNTPKMVDGKQVATPTQVTQVWADDTDAAKVSLYAQSLIVGGNAKAPWQYYKLIDTQWPRGAYSAVPPVPQNAPLPLKGSAGEPNTLKLLNPVLETYMQVTQEQHEAQRSCMACHAYGSVADKKSKYATGFSFLFGRAQSASTEKVGNKQ